jgi:hypothetical protein
MKPREYKIRNKKQGTRDRKREKNQLLVIILKFYT